MNVHDSEKLAGYLEQKGGTKASSLKEADVLVFNTCAIRDTAEKKVMGKIGTIKALKKNNPNLVVCVGGCMTQQSETASALSKKFPYIDIIFGTENLSSFKKVYENFEKTKTRQMMLEVKDDESHKCEPLRDRQTNAWVNIMHGCDNFCSYCIVPYVRGRETSRSSSEIEQEVKELVKQGYPQITLLGQNVNSYKGSKNESLTFSDLLKKLDKIKGKFRLRFMTSHPKDLSDELIETIAASKHVCHGLHLPFQSGSNTVLKKMNRGYTRAHYLKLIEKIKKAIPDAEFSSDCIVGFPGETEEDFQMTISLVKQVEFQSLFTFVYSRRKGTAADKMEDQVSAEVKKERITRLIKIQNQLASENAKKQIGKTFEVLVDGKTETEEYVGSTDTGKIVYFTSKKPNLVSKFVEITITKAKNSKLYGIMKNNED